MNDPMLPEGVTQKDVDTHGGGGWPDGLIPVNAEHGKPRTNTMELEPPKEEVR